jgi:hypothetical protein
MECLMSVRLFALTLALTVPVASPAIAFADEKKAPEASTPDPNEKVCENITLVGSRLAKKRVCATRAEWADRKLQDRQAIDRAQVGACMPQATGAKGRPSC